MRSHFSKGWNVQDRVFRVLHRLTLLRGRSSRDFAPLQNTVEGGTTWRERTTPRSVLEPGARLTWVNATIGHIG
jgi:hypothetical protein